MILAFILSIVSIAILCWLLFALASLALPVFVALWVGQTAHAMGTDLFGAIVFGLLAGFATFILGQLVLMFAPSPVVRFGVALLFVVPAAIAGFSAAHGAAAMGTTSELARGLIGVIGAMAVAMSAWVRLTSTAVMAPPAEPAGPTTPVASA